MPKAEEKAQKLREKVLENVKHLKEKDPNVRLVPGSLRRHSDNIATAMFVFSSGNEILKEYRWLPGGGGTWFDFTPSYSDLIGYQGITEELRKVEQHNLEAHLEPFV